VKKTAVFLLLLVLLFSGAPALADGVFYWTESMPPEIPYQRAMPWFDGGQETLMVQSKYRTATSAAGGLGWVVPVPSVPELASMDPHHADDWFDRVDFASTPIVTRISEVLPAALFLGANLVAVLTLVACLALLFDRRMQYVRRHQSALAAGSVLVLLPLLTVLLAQWDMVNDTLLAPAVPLLVLLVCFLSLFVRRPEDRRGDRAILAVSALLSLATFVVLWMSLVQMYHLGLDTTEAVEIVKTAQVGIYDVQVVKADQVEGLIAWLDGNGFQFDDTDQEVFGDYLRRGWCFVVAQVDPARVGAEGSGSEGLAAPLIVRFPADAPVYPLALTSTAGHKTEILLYLFSQNKWTSGGRLALHYSGEAGVSFGARMAQQVASPGFFTDDELALPYLCKFKGKMTAEEMRQDLMFDRAADEEPYRRHIFVW
jgi:hypothetical protein